MSLSIFLNFGELDPEIGIPALIHHKTPEVRSLLETNEISCDSGVMQGSDIDFHRAEEIETWIGQNCSSMNKEAIEHFDTIAADLLDTWFADVENEKSQIAVTNLLYVVHRIPKGNDPLPKTKAKLQECPATLLVKIFESARYGEKAGSIELLSVWATELLLKSHNIQPQKQAEVAAFARKNPTLTSEALLDKFNTSLVASHAPTP